MTHRCLSHLFINNPLYYAIMPLPATTPTSRNERLITVPFLRPLPTHIALPLPHDFLDDELPCEISVLSRRTVVALDIACLQEHLTWYRNFRQLWEDMDWRGEGAMWIRKTVLHLEHPQLSDPSLILHTAHVPFRPLSSRIAACQSRPTRRQS